MISEDIAKKIKPGAKVRIYEGRIPFTGVVIARKHGNEPGATFTVRSIVSEVGVEKIYPIHSRSITKVEIIKSPPKVRRSKLYYIRKISGKQIKKKLDLTI